MTHSSARIRRMQKRKRFMKRKRRTVHISYEPMEGGLKIKVIRFPHGQSRRGANKRITKLKKRMGWLS